MSELIFCFISYSFSFFNRIFSLIKLTIVMILTSASIALELKFFLGKFSFK